MNLDSNLIDPADVSLLTKSIREIYRSVPTTERDPSFEDDTLMKPTLVRPLNGSATLEALIQTTRVKRLRIYTYPLPSNFNSNFYLTKISGNKRMISAEKRIHELMLSAGVATTNPEVADLFYVPIYPVACCAHEKYSCRSWNERPDCAGCKQGYRLMLEAINYLEDHFPHFFRRNGAQDHIFPAFYDFGLCMETFFEDAKRVRVPGPIRSSIFLSYLGEEASGCYRSERDIVLPPFVGEVSRSTEEAVRQTNDIFMYFRGNVNLHASSRQTRKLLVEHFKATPGSIVSGDKVEVEEMHAEIQRATFCLLPAGFAPWTYRMVEVIRFECIPVFFGSDNDLPFQSLIDYHQMGVVLSGTDEEMVRGLQERLEAITPSQILSKRGYLRRVKPLFSYYSPEFKEVLLYELSLKLDTLHMDPGFTTSPLASPPPALVVASPKVTVPYNFDVDFVYTWVDGSDPKWLALKRAAMHELDGSSVRDDATMNMRFQDREELRYSLRSLEMNAPWVRKVHIVVCCNQKPAWMNLNHPKLNIVQHEDIFPWHLQSALPTFNSFAIESFVDRIPDLAENFVLMNDDFFIGSPVDKSTFYSFDGYPKVAFQDDWFQDWSTCRHNLVGQSAKHSYLWAALNVYRLCDAAFGHEARHLVLHEAYPLTKSLYAKAKKIFPKEFGSTGGRQFRSPKDIIPHFLALFVGFHDGTAIKLGKAEFPRNTIVQIGDDLEENRRNMETIEKGHFKLFCLGDMLSDNAPFSKVEQVTNMLKAWMGRRFPEPSGFEIPEETNRKSIWGKMRSRN